MRAPSDCPPPRSDPFATLLGSGRGGGRARIVSEDGVELVLDAHGVPESLHYRGFELRYDPHAKRSRMTAGFKWALVGRALGVFDPQDEIEDTGQAIVDEAGMRGIIGEEQDAPAGTVIIQAPRFKDARALVDLAYELDFAGCPA